MASCIWIGAAAGQMLTSYWRLLIVIAFIPIFFRRAFLTLAILLGVGVLSLHQFTLGHNYLHSHLNEEASFVVQVAGDSKLTTPKVKGSIHKAAQLSFLANTISIDNHAARLPVRVLLSGARIGYPIGTKLEFTALALATNERKQAAILFARPPAILIAPANSLQRISGQIRTRFNQAAGSIGGDGAALIPGLVLGDTSGESATFAVAMKRSGLTHLTAVSGENFAIVALFLFWIFENLLGALVPRLRARVIIISIFLAAFILLVRPSPSVLRAAVMSALVLLGKWRGARFNPLATLGAAILILILLDPYQASDPGFALSVAATAGILILLPRLPSYLPAGLAASIAATTFCLPIIFAISGQFSLVAIVANSVVEPAVAPVTVIGFIAALTATISAVAAHWLLIIALPFANWIAWWAKFFAAAPVMLLPPGIVGALAAVLLILMLVKIRFRRAKIALAIVIVISLLAYWLPGQSWPGDNWRIVNCDVGQGDGAVLNLGGGAGVVIDAGPDANLMASCLDDLGIKRVPLLILTHFHADHVAGLAGVLRARLIENIWITNYDQPLFDYQATMALLQGRAVTVVHSGQVATMPSKFGELRISVLWPKSEVSNFAALPGDGSSINNQSIALTLREPGFSYFTGGDIEPPAQSEILNSGMAGPVMAMKISHHGSAYQDLALLDLLHPQVAVISVGAGNSYGHPAPMTISALRQRNIEVFRTDLDGAIALAVSGSKVVARLKSKNILSWG